MYIFVEACKNPMLTEAILDIEDIIQVSDAHGACPYYVSREAMKSSELLFVPYNYLIDPRVRSNQHLVVSNAILIFDEAHNLVRRTHIHLVFSAIIVIG
jgi:regulator of telomere elongation helicase 1